MALGLGCLTAFWLPLLLSGNTCTIVFSLDRKRWTRLVMSAWEPGSVAGSAFSAGRFSSTIFPGMAKSSTRTLHLASSGGSFRCRYLSKDSRATFSWASICSAVRPSSWQLSAMNISSSSPTTIHLAAWALLLTLRLSSLYMRLRDLFSSLSIVMTFWLASSGENPW